MMTVRPMRPEDLDAVLAIEESVSRVPWSRRSFVDELGAEGRLWRVADEAGVVRGYVGALIVVDEAHVLNVAVAREAWGRLIATRLLLDVLDGLDALGVRDCTLEVRVSNARAQALYRRLGFEPVGLRRAYYPDNDEDAIVMWLRDLAAPASKERLAAIRRDLEGGAR